MRAMKTMKRSRKCRPNCRSKRTWNRKLSKPKTKPCKPRNRKKLNSERNRKLKNWRLRIRLKWKPNWLDRIRVIERR